MLPSSFHRISGCRAAPGPPPRVGRCSSPVMRRGSLLSSMMYSQPCHSTMPAGSSDPITARCRESGDQATAPTLWRVPDQHSATPPSAFTTYASVNARKSLSSRRPEMNAICRPSGDHTGPKSSQSPRVICVISPEARSAMNRW